MNLETVEKGFWRMRRTDNPNITGLINNYAHTQGIRNLHKSSYRYIILELISPQNDSLREASIYEMMVYDKTNIAILGNEDDITTDGIDSYENVRSEAKNFVLPTFANKKCLSG